jgi:hypothetical protein
MAILFSWGGEFDLDIQTWTSRPGHPDLDIQTWTNLFFKKISEFPKNHLLKLLKATVGLFPAQAHAHPHKEQLRAPRAG